MKKSKVLGMAYWTSMAVGAVVTSTVMVALGKPIITKPSCPVIARLLIDAGFGVAEFILITAWDKHLAQPFWDAKVNAEYEQLRVESNEDEN
jgi:hypothetical protein